MFIGKFPKLLFILCCCVVYKTDSILYSPPQIKSHHAFLTVAEKVERHGYPFEGHRVTTEDGFILTLHRLPRARGGPILLVHGIVESSIDFMLLGPGRALAYLLYDKGFDVWMLNCRGNRYSSKHLKYSRSQSKYWQYSLDEIGRYDLPAAIDFILRFTKFSQLQYIGFSQGTTTFFIMCSERPEYAKKIKLMQALAPVVYLKGSRSGILNFVSQNLNIVKTIQSLVGENEFIPGSQLLRAFNRELCNIKELRGICNNILFMFLGFSKDQFNVTLAPLVASHYPQSCSARQVLHYAQIKKTGIFGRYDYGFFENIRRYSIAWAPKYNLKNVKCKVALYYGPSDEYDAVSDVNRLATDLPNLVELNRINYEKFSHSDFIMGKDAKELVYNQVINLALKHNS